MKSTKVLMEERAVFTQKAKELDERYGDNMPDAILSQYNHYVSEANSLTRQIKASEDRHGNGGGVPGMDPNARPGSKRTNSRQAIEMPGVILSSEDRFVDHFGASDIPNPLGETVRLMISPESKYCVPELRGELTESNSTQAGMMVPSQLSAGFIDLARSKSVLNKLGATTIAMNAPEYRMVKLATDPTFEIKTEATAFDDANITIGGLILHSRLIGAYMVASRELVSDAPNFGGLVEQSLSSALAVQLDAFGLNGGGTITNGHTLVGLNDSSEISETGSISSLSWAEVSAAATAVRGRNLEPNGAVFGVATLDGLKLTADSTGRWLGPPPTLDNVQLESTTTQSATKAIVGDFRECGWGIHQSPMIEYSTVEGESFRRHMVAVKIWYRGDFFILRPSAFQRLAGIS